MAYASVIVETRPIPLRNIVRRHIEFLPKDWELVVFTGEKDDFAKAELAGIKTRFIKIHTQNLTVSLYNKLLTNKDFWSVLNYEKVLIFQHDSGLLREGIEDFLMWDFIGAPIKHIKYPALKYSHCRGKAMLKQANRLLQPGKKEMYGEVHHGYTY